MKKFKHLMCAIVFAMMVFLTVSGCGEKPNPNVKVDFNTLKSMVECTSDLTGWNGVRATVISASKGNSSFKSNKQTSGYLDIVDYLHIKGDNQTYCDDNVEYYKDGDRKYMNEDFDYSKVMDNLLSECMPSVIEFFSNRSNYSKLISSDKTEENGNTIYTFAMWIDKSANKFLEAKFIYNSQKILLSINVEIKVGDNKDFVGNIVPNEEIINTPNWFDSNDFKVEMSYQEVKDIVLDENLFDDWQNAHLHIPEIVGNEQDIYMSRPTTADGYKYYSVIKKYSGENDGKIYYSNGKEYIYVGNAAHSINEYDVNSRSFASDISEYSTMCFQQFFFDNNENESYYVNAKKYEKDRTVVSFKFEHEYANQVLIGALYYNLQNELYYIDVYFAMDNDGGDREEMHFSFEKLSENLSRPDWFDENDFGQTIPSNQLASIFTHDGISQWGGSYSYTASINMQGSQYISDGVHFKESATIYNDNGNISYYTNMYVSDEAQNAVRESAWEDSGYTFAEAGTYTFWVNKKFENKESYATNNVRYEYKNGTKNQVSYAEYKPDYFDAFLSSFINILLSGQYMSQIEVPARLITNLIAQYNSNIPTPGDVLKPSYGTKTTINNLDVYTIKYVANNNKNSFLEYSIALDKNGDLQKIEISSNFLVAVQGVATFTLQKNTTPILQPEWY